MTSSLVTLSQLTLALVLLASGVAKGRTARTRGEFARSVRDLTPSGPAAPWVATAVIAAELVTGAALLVPGMRRPAALVAMLLLLAFTGVLLLAVRRGSRATCRCFGSASAPVGRLHLARNAGLVGLAALALLPGGVTTVPVLAIVAFVSAALAICVVGLDELATLLSPRPQES